MLFKSPGATDKSVRALQLKTLDTDHGCWKEKSSSQSNARLKSRRHVTLGGSLTCVWSLRVSPPPKDVARLFLLRLLLFPTAILRSRPTRRAPPVLRRCSRTSRSQLLLVSRLATESRWTYLQRAGKYRGEWERVRGKHPEPGWVVDGVWDRRAGGRAATA